jgi:PAS domain S-box-containing protein
MRLGMFFGMLLASQFACSQSIRGGGIKSVDLMIRYFNADQLDSAAIVSDSIMENPLLSNSSKYWFYRGLIYKELFKKYDRGNPRSEYRGKSESALIKALELESDNDIISGIKKNIDYLAATYYNDAVRLLEDQKPNISLSISTFDSYNTLMNITKTHSHENKNKFLNALGSFYGNLFNEEKDIKADAYYELAKKYYEAVLATDSNQTAAKYNLVVLETNYKTKKERLLKEESSKKDREILSLNAVKKLEDDKLIESQLVKESQREELRLLKSEREKKELEIRTNDERKDALAQKAKQKQNIILWSLTSGLIIIIAFSLLVYKNSREKEKLNKELKKLTFAVSKSTNTVLVFDSNIELQWVNKNFLDTYGISLDQFKLENRKSLFDISSHPDIRYLVKESIRTRAGVSYESVLTTDGMGKRWFQSMMSPIFDDSGNFQNLMIIDSEITKLKEIEEEISQKNKDITDSIHYAKRIQQSVLPVDKKVRDLLSESFILYNPKDIISGDFYWVGNNEDKSKVVVAAVDCTGHGVPGALLTIMANDLLNTIVLHRGITNPKEIINEMDSGIIDLMTIEEEGFSRDGMDMAVIEIERKDNYSVIKYAGAYNPLYYIRDKQLYELAPLRFNIGSIPAIQKDTMVYHTLETQKNDMVYLFSDGYADQLNGQTGKKFMKGKFKQLLLEIHEKPVDEQKNILEKKIKDWRGDTFQTDDMLVIGLRF